MAPPFRERLRIQGSTLLAQQNSDSRMDGAVVLREVLISAVLSTCRSDSIISQIPQLSLRGVVFYWLLKYALRLMHQTIRTSGFSRPRPLRSALRIHGYVRFLMRAYPLPLSGVRCHEELQMDLYFQQSRPLPLSNFCHTVIPRIVSRAPRRLLSILTPGHRTLTFSL